MPGLFSREKAVPLTTKLASAFALLLWVPLAMAQNNLGELLDAGAKQLTVEEFKEQVVQRMIVGPTATGARLEVMYTANGMVQGTGGMAPSQIALAEVSGDWTMGDNGRICTSMRIGGAGGAGGQSGVILPPRCQFWFKLADQYYLSDSDSDRRTRVLRRTLKR